MLAALRRHPHAQAVLGGAVEEGRPSHAYLFHGPGGAGKREAARGLAAELLAEGSGDPEGAKLRVRHGTHPDLTWVTPSGAHEMLVSDIDEPVVAAASKTPFESSRRVFVLERVDELGEEAANRMLKTLEEPAAFVHLILLTDRLGEVLPTIRSRCQLVRFEPPGVDQLASELEAAGADVDAAHAAVALALQDADRARELISREGRALRAAGETFARVALAGQMASKRPWVEILAAVRARGEAAAVQVGAQRDAELELTSSRDRRRVQTDWSERERRVRRRAQTAALDLALQIASLWFSDLAFLALGAPDLVRNGDRRAELTQDAETEGGARPERLQAAVELVEDTRLRFALNVSEDLACEALGYRLEQALVP